ncbi:polymeric immunoglobulin receptor-like isoform X10, partial [Clarias magur]
MKILLIFTLCLISDGGDSKEVNVCSGGGVLIKCKYHTVYTQNNKYFCKGSTPRCSDQIKAKVKNKWINKGRFSLYNHTESLEFWVMIRELTVEDTGTYHCGVNKDRKRGKDVYLQLELKVNEGAFGLREVIAYAGGGVNIKCKYKDGDKDKLKGFCKNGTDQWCFNNKRPQLISEWSHDGRFSVHDNRSAGFFSVFIRELTVEDTGTYACAVAVSDDIQTYSVVKLEVRGDLPVSGSTLKPITTSSSSSSSSSSSPLSSSSSSSSSSSQSIPAFPQAGFPAFTVITVSVIVLLLLTGITLITLQKRRKMEAGRASTDQCSDLNSGNNQEVPLAVCEYEEIKDIRRLYASDRETAAVYSSVQLPTIPSDQDIYTTAQLPTIPSDQEIYTTALLPTIPSDQGVYSTAQLLTDQTAEESAEGALGVREVIAYAGGGVNIKCKYEKEYTNKTKAFCKNGTDQWCFSNKRPELISEWSHDGRFSVHDNRNAGLLRVFIRKLVTEDTGTYACAVDVSDKIQTYSVVKLAVRKDLFYEMFISKTVHVGGDLNISFKYPESLTNMTKYLCKRLHTATCSHKVSVNAGNKHKENTKANFSLYDDRERQILNVSIRNVTERDAGEFWCGAEAAWESDHGYKVYFTQIILTVTGKTLKPTTPSSSSQSIPASPPAVVPASTVITVSVILPVILIGITLIILTLQKRMEGYAGRASTDQCSDLNSGNNQE